MERVICETIDPNTRAEHRIFDVPSGDIRRLHLFPQTSLVVSCNLFGPGGLITVVGKEKRKVYMVFEALNEELHPIEMNNPFNFIDDRVWVGAQNNLTLLRFNFTKIPGEVLRTFFRERKD